MDEILTDLSYSIGKRLAIPAQTASITDPRWIFQNKEGSQTLTQEGDVFTINFPAGTSSAIYYFSHQFNYSAYVECEFLDLEPGTTTILFITSSVSDFGTQPAYLTGQTFPTSKNEYNQTMGEGWFAIMEYGSDTILHRPRTLIWSPDVEPFGKIRMSKSGGVIKVHKGNEYIFSALTSENISNFYCGLFTYSYASEEPRFTKFKNLKCGNY